MYILYGGDFTRAPLVQWVLEEGRLEYELRKIDVLKGEHRTADFLTINPAGFVPVLVTPEGDALYEVAALMVYLADRHELTDLAPAVTDPRRGVFLSTVFNIASDIQSELKRFYYPHRFSLRREDDAGIRELATCLSRTLKTIPYVDAIIFAIGHETKVPRIICDLSLSGLSFADVGSGPFCRRKPDAAPFPRRPGADMGSQQ